MLSWSNLSASPKITSFRFVLLNWQFSNDWLRQRRLNALVSPPHETDSWQNFTSQILDNLDSKRNTKGFRRSVHILGLYRMFTWTKRYILVCPIPNSMTMQGVRGAWPSLPNWEETKSKSICNQHHLQAPTGRRVNHSIQMENNGP